jgi:hypothetical protein
METAHEPLDLEQMKFSFVKEIDIPTSFIWIIILFDEAFKYGDGAKFRGHASANAEPICRIL